MPGLRNFPRRFVTQTFNFAAVADVSAELFNRFLHDPDLGAFYGTDQETLLQGFVARHENLTQSDAYREYVVLKDAKIIGLLGFDIAHTGQGETVNIFHYVAQEERRKGYGSQMVREATGYAFENTGITELISAVGEADNEGSIKLLRDLGFRPSPKIVDQTPNATVFALNKGDWPPPEQHP
jgi:RimJ/RimL family protein N-acetyltransferase